MRIVGITVCVRFGDYLQTTAEHNLPVFDDWIVVTDPQDLETIEVCKSNGLIPVLSRRHQEHHEDDFNKGKMINDGIKAASKLSDKCWLCHTDADIVLPKDLRARLERSLRLVAAPTVFRRCLFGMHRLMCNSREDWEYYLQAGNTSRFELECKRSSKKNLPVGFFQMWHNSRRLFYPERFGTATTSDLEFAKNFKIQERRFFDEYCIHLSQPGWCRGRDWKGRVSQRWSG